MRSATEPNQLNLKARSMERPPSAFRGLIVGCLIGGLLWMGILTAGILAWHGVSAIL